MEGTTLYWENWTPKKEKGKTMERQHSLRENPDGPFQEERLVRGGGGQEKRKSGGYRPLKHPVQVGKGWEFKHETTKPKRDTRRGKGILQVKREKKKKSSKWYCDLGDFGRP